MSVPPVMTHIYQNAMSTRSGMTTPLVAAILKPLAEFKTALQFSLVGVLISATCHSSVTH